MRIPGFSYDAKRHRARFDVYVPGSKGQVRRRQTVENVTRDQALTAWREFRASCANPTVIRTALTLQQFIDDYYGLISAPLRVSTVRTQRLIMKNHLSRFFGTSLLADITTIRVLDFKTDMRNRGLSAAYINDAVRLLKTLLYQAVERDVIAEHPLKKRVRKEPENLPRLELEQQERIAFLAVFEDERNFRALLATERRLGPVRESAAFGEPRRFGGGRRPDGDAARAFFERFQELRDFFVVALETGLRIWSDLRNLRWRDVDLAGGVITVATRKTGHEAIITISKECRGALLRCRERRDPGEFVFVDGNGRQLSASRIRRAFLLAKRLAGITRRFRPHDLRHTFGCRLASRGVSLQLIAKSLGHTTTHMAERYARPSKEAMRAVAEALDADRAPVGTTKRTKVASNHSSVRISRAHTVALVRMVRARKERKRYAATQSSTHQPMPLEHL
jgi:integrase